jgi:hypothetical protein
VVGAIRLVRPTTSDGRAMVTAVNFVVSDEIFTEDYFAVTIRIAVGGIVRVRRERLRRSDI